MVDAPVLIAVDQRGWICCTAGSRRWVMAGFNGDENSYDLTRILLKTMIKWWS